MADPAQTPPRGDWNCPCTGCQKARKMAFEDIIEMLYQDNDIWYNAYLIRERYKDEFPTKPKRKQ